MRRTNFSLSLLVLLALGGLLTACGSSAGTFVVVAIQPGASTPSGIRSIDLELVLGGRMTTATFTNPHGGDISLPTDGSLQIGSGSGELSIVARARGAGGQLLDSGSATGMVTSGGTTHVTVMLGTPIGDGGTGDGAGGGSGNDGAAGNDGGPQGAVVTADKTTFDFGTVVTGSTSSATVVTVQNTGSQRTGALIVGVVDAVSFPTSADTCNGTELDPGATCTLSVKFQPASPGAKTTTLRIGGTPGGTASVSLSGMGVDPGALVVTPAQKDFGAVSQSQSSSETTFRVSNTGGAPTSALTTALTGTNAGDFRISSDTCAGMTLQPNGTCTVGVTFSPAATGTPGAKSATLTASATTGGTTVATLSGTAQGPASLMVVPTDQDFGMVVQGLQSAEQQFTVTNGGGQPSGTLAASIAPTGEFAITSNSCNTTLAAGASCTVGVKMTPSGLGNRTATLTVAGSPGGTVNASLHGTGLAPGMIVLSPSPKDFGTVDVGSPASAAFMVTNSGQAATTALSVTLSGADFTLATAGNTCSGQVLAANASCTFSVTFNPATFGPKTGSVMVAATTGGSSMAALSGTGRDFVALTVTKNGTGAGTVAATGLLCSGNTCAGQYARTSSSSFQMVSISAAPDAYSTFGGWGGACTGNGACTVTMDAAKSVTATFTVKTVKITINNISLSGHSGTITAADGSVNCPTGACGPITHNAVASLVLTANPGTTSTFAGWSGGPCQGSKPTCTLAPLTGDVMITATFAPQAYMFVTSTLVTPGRLGGVGGADTECSNRASAAGLPGRYSAWISDKTATAAIDAVGRVGTGGWVRTDGRPFAASASALKTTTNQVVWYPPRVDEFGNDLGPNRITVVTGGNSDGTNFGTAQCGNYNATAGGTYIGQASAGSQTWAYDSLDSSACSGLLHLYCFRNDLAATITVPPVPGRRIFVSTAPFTVSGGLTMADQQCQLDAKNAGLTNFGNFMALLSTVGAPAISRVSLTGMPWKRVDEVMVTLNPGDLANRLFASIDVSPTGIHAPRQVWTGSTDVTIVSDGNDCNDWLGGGIIVPPTTGTAFAAGPITGGNGYIGYPSVSHNPDWFHFFTSDCGNVNTYLICAER